MVKQPTEIQKAFLKNLFSSLEREDPYLVLQKANDLKIPGLFDSNKEELVIQHEG